MGFTEDPNSILAIIIDGLILKWWFCNMGVGKIFCWGWENNGFFSEEPKGFSREDQKWEHVILSTRN